MKYYEQKGDDQMVACINFDHFMHALKADTKDASVFSVEIVNSEQKFMFKARNIQESGEW